MRKWIVLTILICTLEAAEYRAPAGNQPPIPRVGAESVLPGGRMIAPVGRQFSTGPGPFGVAVSPKGRFVVTADTGPQWVSVTVIEHDERGRYRKHLLRAPREGTEEAKRDTWRGVQMGIAFRNENEVFVSEGEYGLVRLLSVRKGETEQLFELNRHGAADSFAGDLAYDRRRRLIYVADQANFRVVIFDERKKREVASVSVGRFPFMLALSADGRRVYVTHAGLFEYQPLPGADPADARRTGLPFPAFGWPSEEARLGIRRRTERGEVAVPGLGPADVPEACSLAVIDTSDPAEPRLLRYVRTGKPPRGRPAECPGPVGVIEADGRVYVSNANLDSITVLDAETLRVTGEIELRIQGLKHLRGIMPAGLAYHAGSGWLFVAEAGINAVGVVDTRTGKVLGHIPTAWYPVRVAVHEDDVYAVCAIGYGAGANANKLIALKEAWPRIGGGLTVFPVPAPHELGRLTRRTMELNGFRPLRRARPPAYPKQVRHVVLILKEGRSYDEILGDIGKVGLYEAEGAPLLARYGRFGSAKGIGGGFASRFSLRNVNVTPNHHAMAVRWAFSDNFYSDASTGTGGHHWVAGTPPNPWVMSSLLAAYGGMKSFVFGSPAPGRRGFPDTRTSVHPEAVLETGTLWHHLARHGVSFFNFGEGFELAGAEIGEGMEPTGVRFLTNVPMLEPLYGRTSRNYPGYNTDIPDQYRATQFISEIRNRFLAGDEEFPRFLFIYLPNDDTAMARPRDGYPFPASFIADNDYALGRIVEFLSQIPQWKNMVIFITEDDATGGVDHVNANRVPFIAVGPWIRRGYVSHRNVSFPGLHKTIFRLLGIPPLHLFDAAATDLSDMFTSDPDFTPYVAQEVAPELFQPAKARPAAPR